jgi:hypothetical protein
VYNLYASLGIAAVVFAVAWLAFGAVPAAVPAMLAFALAQFLLGRRTGAAIQLRLAGLEPLLRERKIDEAVALLEGIKAEFGRWHFLLENQIDAQLGTLDYMQLRWEEARPRLESGSKGLAGSRVGRNWSAAGLLGALHWRQGRKELAWKAFEAAAESSGPDPILFQVWATLLVRDGKRPEALAAVAKGLQVHPKHKALEELQATIANDRKVDPRAFGQLWYQFFPEDLARDMAMTGKRAGMPEGAPRPEAPRVGARHAPRR